MFSRFTVWNLANVYLLYVNCSYRVLFFVLTDAYNSLTCSETNLPATPQSVYDVASLTKVLATVPAVMFLHQEGKLDPEAPVSHYIPEFGQNGKDKITVAQVMTHTAGLKVFYDFNVRGLRSKESILEFIYADQLWHPVGETVYSDLSMMVVGALVERYPTNP